MYDCECPKCSNGYYHITIGIVLHWNKNFAKKHDWCWKFELKTRVYQFVWNKRKTFPESQQWDNHWKNIRKDRQNWAYTDFWRDIQQIADPQKNTNYSIF